MLHIPPHQLGLLPSISPIAEAVVKDKVLLTVFVDEHYLPLTISHNNYYLTSAMFLLYKASRAPKQKTVRIFKEVLFPNFTDSVVKLCCETTFSVLRDEGNNSDNENFAILVC